MLLDAPDSCNPPTPGFNGSRSPLTSTLAFRDECLALHAVCAARIALRGIEINSFYTHTFMVSFSLSCASSKGTAAMQLEGQQEELALQSRPVTPTNWR